MCVTADIWQERCGRIDSVNSWLKKAKAAHAETKVIQAPAGTFLMFPVILRAFVLLHLGKLRDFSGFVFLTT